MFVSVCIDGTITITIARRSVWFFPTSNGRMLDYAQEAHGELSYVVKVRKRESQRYFGSSITDVVRCSTRWCCQVMIGYGMMIDCKLNA